MSEGPESYREIDQRRVVWLIVVVLVLVALFVFWLQNGETIEVEILFVSVQMPIWLLIVVSMVLGGLLFKGAGYLWSRRRSAR